MSWKIILAAGAILLAAAPSLAEDTRPGGTVFRQRTCDEKHSTCIVRCQRSFRDGDQLNACMEICAGKWLKCKGSAAREGSEVTTTQPEPTRK
jgi:hypothetical protein